VQQQTYIWPSLYYRQIQTMRLVVFFFTRMLVACCLPLSYSATALYWSAVTRLFRMPFLTRSFGESQTGDASFKIRYANLYTTAATYWNGKVTLEFFKLPTLYKVYLVLLQWKIWLLLRRKSWEVSQISTLLWCVAI